MSFVKTRRHRSTCLAAGLCLLASGAAQAAGAGPAPAPANTPAAACPTLLQQTQPRPQDEKPVNLCDSAGKVVLVLNTASYCGFTGQSKSLEALYARYRTRGLVVLGLPRNDFGQQEPGSSAEIAAFARTPSARACRCLPNRMWRPAPGAASTRCLPRWPSAAPRCPPGTSTNT